MEVDGLACHDAGQAGLWNSQVRYGATGTHRSDGVSSLIFQHGLAKLAPLNLAGGCTGEHVDPIDLPWGFVRRDLLLHEISDPGRKIGRASCRERVCQYV